MNRAQALLVGLAVGFGLVAAGFVVTLPSVSSSPEQVARRFFIENYAHNYAAAWEWVSASDQAARSQREYVAARPELTDAQAALYEQLADWGEFQVVAIVSDRPDHAIVTAHTRFPDDQQTAIQVLLQQAASDGADPEALLDQLAQLHGADLIRFVEDETAINLVQAAGSWRIVQHWGRTFTVRLAGSVSAGLPWTFYPLDQEISVAAGETATASYFARNDSERPTTGKAIHEIGPPEVADYFETIECFCFTEQTLGPGEAREMTLVFQIDMSVPPGEHIFHDRYTFYPLDEFPADG